MRFLTKILVTFSLLLLLAGCSSGVQLSTKSPALPKSAHALAHRSLNVAPVSDRRDEFEPNMLMHFAMEGNEKRYGVYAREAIGKTLGNTLAQTLRKNGYRVSTKHQALVLETRLQSLKMKWLPSMWKAELLGSMHVTFRLENTNTGKIIWSDSFVARAKDNKYSTHQSIQSVYRQMSDSLMRQLLTSPGFRHAVQRG